MNRPKALVCYICGRQFGTKSLAIHLKACEKKWENEQNLKPPKERRPCPRPPQGLDNLLEKGSITAKDINQFNSNSFNSFVEEALVQCEYCFRRFNPQSLVPHQKACKTKPMLKKNFQNKGPLGKHSQPEQEIKPMGGGYNFKQEMAMDNGQSNANLVPCRRCKRTFAADRVGKHERVCKADPPQKQPPKIEQKVQAPKFKPFGKEKKAIWKVQHQELQNAMKAMRQMKAVQARGGKISDLPPPPPSNYDHYVQCRHCGRKYAQDVAQRHIPKCANIINKPGGIKPSKIQDKYVSGTGANKSNTYVQPPHNSNALKPNFSTANSYNYGSSGSSMKSSNPMAGQIHKNNYQKEPTSPFSNPFGNNYKPSSNSKQTRQPPPSYEQKPSSNIKPNLKGSSNSRSNANKYW